MILIIDNYDSFTYNLVQRLGEIDAALDLQVVRNDKSSAAELLKLEPSHLAPVLGVCLGHQSIGQSTGGTIVRAQRLMHGKTDEIKHDSTGLFVGLPNPMIATRYHSLVIQPDTLSDEFEINAWTFAPDGSKEIMGIRHKTHGVDLLKNFLATSVAVA